MFFTNKEIVLPFSAGRYRLNEFGDILDINNEVIETRIIDGKKTIELAWFDGLKRYDVGDIIAIAVNNIHLPSEHWKEIESIYDDGDQLNTNISNITYRFRNGPIEVSSFPGFFYIPYYTRYALSVDGKLLSLRTGRFNSWSLFHPRKKKNIKGGYRLSRALRDIGTTQHISRHRGLCLTFKRYDINPFRLVVNHKNGVPGNDELENLEWVTRAENNKHAYRNGLLPNKTVKILMRDEFTGIVKQYNSVAECAESIGRPSSSVFSRLSKLVTRYSDGLRFKIDNGSDWPVLTDKVVKSSIVREVLCRNIFTGEIIICTNATEAGNLANVSHSTVLNHVNDRTIKAINGYNFRFFEDSVSWPNHNKDHLKIYRLFPRCFSYGVFVRDKDGNDVEIFDNIEKVSLAYNVPVKRLYRLSCTGLSFNEKGYSLFILRLTEKLGPAIQ